MVELGLTPNDEAYTAQYYGYLMNGLLTQTIRIKEGDKIEEAHMRNRALIALGLTPNDEAYTAQYYGYLMNGLLTQTIRIKEGDKIEEAHMRNRALIAWWVMEHAEGAGKATR